MVKQAAMIEQQAKAMTAYQTYLNESAPARAFAVATAAMISGVIPGTSFSVPVARFVKRAVSEDFGRPASSAAGAMYSGTNFVSLLSRIVTKIAVATEAPPLRIEPSAPSAAPMSSVAHDKGARDKEHVSMIPTE